MRFCIHQNHKWHSRYIEWVSLEIGLGHIYFNKIPDLIWCSPKDVVQDKKEVSDIGSTSGSLEGGERDLKILKN